jgi:hypothetical protein
MDQELWYIYTMGYCSAIRNSDMWFEGKWMQLENIMLTEISQEEKQKAACFLSYVEDTSKDKRTQKPSMIIYKLRCRTFL